MPVQIYIDPINGSDGSFGDSIAQAFQTLAGAYINAPNGITINVVWPGTVGAALNTTWTVPDGITAVKMRCIGGGGGSGSTVGGGGGGCEIVNAAAVTPGESLTIGITSGGLASSGTGGGTATIKRSGTTLCGAIGGQNGNAGGSGGGTTVITGAVRHTGGSGDSGGGGAAGDTANGGAGGGTTPGTAGTDTGGFSGAGGTGVGTGAVGSDYGGGGGSGSSENNGGKALIVISFTYTAAATTPIVYEVGGHAGAHFPDLAAAELDTGNSRAGWTYHPNTHIILRLGSESFAAGTGGHIICMDTPGPGCTITITASTVCGSGVLPVITGTLTLGIDNEVYHAVQANISGIQFGSAAVGGRLVISGMGWSTTSTLENVWKGFSLHDVLFTGASMTLAAGAGYLTLQSCANSTASIFNLVMDNSNGMAASHYPIQFSPGHPGTLGILLSHSTIYVPAADSGAIRLNPSGGGSVSLTAANNIIAGTTSTYISVNATNNGTTITVAGSGNRGGTNVPGTTDTTGGLTAAQLLANPTGGDLTTLSNASTLVVATTTSIATDFNGAARPQLTTWVGPLGAAAIGSPMVFAGAYNAAIVIYGLSITKSGATWMAFQGAASYQISIGGGAFSATGISGTTYTGSIVIGQRVVVQALDGSANVLAQAEQYFLPLLLDAGQMIPLALL